MYCLDIIGQVILGYSKNLSPSYQSRKLQQGKQRVPVITQYHWVPTNLVFFNYNFCLRQFIKNGAFWYSELPDNSGTLRLLLLMLTLSFLLLSLFLSSSILLPNGQLIQLRDFLWNDIFGLLQKCHTERQCFSTFFEVSGTFEAFINIF